MPRCIRTTRSSGRAACATRAARHPGDQRGRALRRDHHRADLIMAGERGSAPAALHRALRGDRVPGVDEEVRGAAAQGDRREASDVMTEDPITIHPTRRRRGGAEIARHKHNRLPVVEHGRLIGVVTRIDVLDALTAECAGEARSTRARSSATAPGWRRWRRCARWSRPTATGTARSRPRGRRSAAARRGWRWRPRARPRSCAPRARGPLLVMGALSRDELRVALEARRRRRRVARGVRRELPGDARVHVKLDTGMGRLGTRDPAEATRVAEAVAARGLRLAGAMTHFATADDDPAFMARAARALPAVGRQLGVMRHAANSAAALREPAARLDMIRCGIAIYGMDPFHRDPADHGLEPALELVSYVAEVKRARAGESVGLRAALHRRARHLDRHDPDRLRRRRPARADGPRRGRWSAGGACRWPGRCRWTTSPSTSATSRSSAAPRRSCSARAAPSASSPRTWARALGTINYEVTCGLSRAGAADASMSEALDDRARGAGRRGRPGWSAAPCATSCSAATPTTSTSRSPATRSGTRSEIARAAGGAAFQLSGAFGAWRVVGPEHAWHVDLVTLRDDDIHADLAQRDFTINAMAEPLGGGELLDPHGGRADLERRLVRMVSRAGAARTTRCAACARSGSRSSSTSRSTPRRAPRRPANAAGHRAGRARARVRASSSAWSPPTPSGAGWR